MMHAMNTKLTLRLDEQLISTAKAYSRKTGKSVSQIVAELFEAIGNEEVPGEQRLPPTVESLRGILKGKAIDELDYKEYLEKKHA